MDRDHLLAKGYVHLKARLSQELISQYQHIADKLLKSEAEDHRARVRSNGSMINLARHAVFATLLSSDTILDALKSLGGEDVRWTGGYLISKPAGGPPLFWHQDWWGWDEEISFDPAPAQLFVMIYLTETRPENGCLRVIPGSHVRAHDLHEVVAAHSKNLAAATDLDNPAFARSTDEIAISVKPGDLVIGDARVIHGAYANRTEEERPLLTLWYTPNYGRLPASMRAAYALQMKDQTGDVQESNGSNLTPFDWPESQRTLMAGLLPTDFEAATPTAWNRLPDLQRMKV